MRADFERRSSCFGGSLSTSYWTPSKGSIFRFNEKECPLAKHRLSDNVVPVKYFLGVLTRALRRARHFALVEAVPYQPRPARNPFQVRNSVRPMHLFGHTFDHDYYFELPREEGAGYPINYSMLDFTPWRYPGCPACEPNFFTCS